MTRQCEVPIVVHTVLFCALFLILRCAPWAEAAIIAGPMVNPANGHSYYLLATDTWSNSEAEAQSLGGHLVTINDADENQWVYDTFVMFGGTEHNLWIGFTDAHSEGHFIWSSGESVSFTNWLPGQPDNWLNEDYVHLMGPGHPQTPHGTIAWNDWKNDSLVFYSYPMNGVVEVVPEPVCACAMLAAALGFIIRRNSP